jgi:hypothetical protein
VLTWTVQQRLEPEERTEPAGIPSARPGRSSEITAARHDRITAHLREAGLGALADLGFVGLDDRPDDDPVIIAGRKAPGTTDSPMPRRRRTG